MGARYWEVIVSGIWASSRCILLTALQYVRGTNVEAARVLLPSWRPGISFCYLDGFLAFYVLHPSYREMEMVVVSPVLGAEYYVCRGREVGILLRNGPIRAGCGEKRGRVSVN